MNADLVENDGEDDLKEKGLTGGISFRFGHIRDRCARIGDVEFGVVLLQLREVKEHGGESSRQTFILVNWWRLSSERL